MSSRSAKKTIMRVYRLKNFKDCIVNTLTGLNKTAVEMHNFTMFEENVRAAAGNVGRYEEIVRLH